MRFSLPVLESTTAATHWQSSRALHADSSLRVVQAGGFGAVSADTFCTHREVKPYAGTTGFDADAWCPDCQYYKLRRAPKKREPRDEYSY